MSVLLTDASLCSNDFSRLLYTPVLDWSIHAHVAGTTTAGSPLTQHTEYKIAITAVPRNSLEHDSRSFEISARFKELNRLWAQLAKVHKQLYLHGIYPTFAPTKIFGNTEPTVIAERVDAITRFLNFVFGNDVLRKAKSLHHFFEGAAETGTPGDETQPIATSGLHPTESVSSEELLVDTGVTPGGGEGVGEAAPSLDQQESPNEQTPEASGLLIQNECQMTSSGSASNLGAHSSSSCLLFDFPDADLQAKELENSQASPSTSQACIRGVRSSDFLAEDQVPQSFLRKVLPKIVHLSSPQPERRLNSGAGQLYGVSNIQRSSSSGSFFERTSVAGLQTQSSTNASAGSASSQFPFPPSLSPQLSLSTATKSNDYLAVAAQFIAAAQKAESESAFELAFQCYKGAVKALLQGVQFERDLPRRNRVRKKTAKYLLKAENLYRSYLSFDGSAFEAASWLSSSVQDPNLLAFQSSNTLLKSYRVKAFLPSMEAKDRVFLVESLLRNDRGIYVMKMLEKSGADKSLTNGPSIIPVDVPNMVQLHKFFNTDSFIILLLEHIKCGRLWDFLNEYFAEQQRQIEDFLYGKPYENDRPCLEDFVFGSSPSSEQRDYSDDANVSNNDSLDRPGPSVLPPVTECKQVRRKNTYEGKHVRFSVGDADEATDLADVDETDQGFSQNLKKVSTTSYGSIRSGDTSFVTANNEADFSLADDSNPGSSLNTAVRHISDQSDTFFSDFASIPEAEEEAPAPITLCSESTRSASTSHNRSDSGELSLGDALEKAKLTLKEGKCWSRRCQVPEALVAFWMSQLVSAVYFLHAQGVVIRDLRPDNLLLDDEANLRLTYCSQWQNVESHIDDYASSNLYAAPETASVSQRVTGAADRWSIGAILFELICGRKMSEICLHGFEALSELPIPDCVSISFAARDLLSRLLVSDPLQRISDDELRAHPFFDGIDWRLCDQGTPDISGQKTRLNDSASA